MLGMSKKRRRRNGSRGQNKDREAQVKMTKGMCETIWIQKNEQYRTKYDNTRDKVRAVMANLEKNVTQFAKILTDYSRTKLKL